MRRKQFLLANCSFQQPKHYKIKSMQKQTGTPAISLFKLVQDENNSHCLICSKPSKQWVQFSHAIFLCLECAAEFRQIIWVTRVKSVNLDPWTRDEVQRLQKGGNRRFADYLKHYGLNNAQIRLICCCRASAFYRAMLNGEAEGLQPSVEQGRKISKEDIPLFEMTSAELLESTKEKALWLGSKTKELGEKGYEKIKSGEFTEEARKAAASVTETAKELWNKVSPKKEQESK